MSAARNTVSGALHGHAGFERRLPQALLQHGFRLRQLRLGIDAAHFVLLHLDRRRLQTHFAGNRHRIRQIEFPLRVVVANPFQDIKRLFSCERHQPAVAERDRAFLRRRIFLFTDGGELPAFHDQPPVAGRVGRAETQHRHCRAFRQCAAQAPQRFGAQQRRIAEDNHHIVRAARDGSLRHQHRMGGAAPFLLHMDFRVGDDPPGLGRHRLMARTDHHRGGDAARLAYRRQHMSQQRPAGQRVQHLG